MMPSLFRQSRILEFLPGLLAKAPFVNSSKCAILIGRDLNRKSIGIVKESLRYKSEATCTKKVYSDNGVITSGPPTFTLFATDVCLTVKLKVDDTSNDKSILLTGMTRLKDGSNNFNKNSRVSALISSDHLNKLSEALINKGDSQISLQGSDGSSVDVNFNGDSFSIKLTPTLLPGLNINSGHLPAKGKQAIEFIGNQNEHKLIIHALKEISTNI